MSEDLLAFIPISSRDDWLKWALTNPPDHGGDTRRFQLVKEAVERKFGSGGHGPAPQRASATAPPRASAAAAPATSPAAASATKRDFFNTDFFNSPFFARKKTAPRQTREAAHCCTATTQRGTKCSCPRVAEHELCWRHLRVLRPELAKSVDDARLQHEAERIVEAEVKEAVKKQRVAELAERVQKLRADKELSSTTVPPSVAK